MIYSFWRPVWLVFDRGDGMIMSENVGQVENMMPWAQSQLTPCAGVQAKELCCVPSWQMTWHRIISQSKCIPCENTFLVQYLWYSMIFHDILWLCGELCRKEEHNHRNTFWPAQLWRVCPDIMKSRNLGVGPKLSQQPSGPACRLQWLPQTRLCSLGKSCTSGEPCSRRDVATKCTSMSISRTPWRSLFPNIKSYIRQIL